MGSSRSENPSRAAADGFLAGAGEPILRGYQRFEAAVAIDDAADGHGGVTFGVYVLRDGKLSEAYKSGIVRGGDAPQRVSVDVAGAQGITLVVDYAERGDEMDRADWLDARLVRN
jgi:hypothetical protein